MRRAAAPELKGWLDDRFLSIVKKGNQSQIETLQKKIDNCENEIKAHESNRSLDPEVRENTIEDIKKQIRKLKNQQAFYTNANNESQSISSSKIEENLKKHPSFDELSIVNGKLNIYTKMLRHGTKNLGKFRIHIESRDRWGGGALGVLNMSYRKGNLSHWAVNSGDCCLAEWDPIMKKFYEEGRLDQFFEAVIHFLTLSPDVNTFCTIPDWYDHRETLTKEQKEEIRNEDREFRDVAEDWDEDEDDY